MTKSVFYNDLAATGSELTEKMIQDLSWRANLPVCIPQEAKALFAKATESPVIGECPWITLSLIHRSYLNEHPELVDAHVSGRTLELLRGLGACFLELALSHLAYNDLSIRTMKELIARVDGMKQNVEFRIIRDLNLVAVAYWGAGALSTATNATRITSSVRDIGRQFLGAVRICGGYEAVLRLVEATVRTLLAVSPQISSYKSEIQEFVQGHRHERPTYETVQCVGPEHQRTFRVRVWTKDGRSAVGEGSSKKRAEEAAAREYMEEYANEYLKQKHGSRESKLQMRATHHIIPNLHMRQVERLASKLSIPRDKVSLLSQALVHRSFLNETSLENCLDNSFLAHIGSRVLNALTMELVVAQLLRTDLDGAETDVPEIVVSAVYETSRVAGGYDLLELDGALLVGRGQDQQGIAERMKAETFQAVLGTIFLSRERLRSAEEFLPACLLEWWLAVIERIQGKPTIQLNPKGMLQEQLQAMQMHWQYEHRSWGPEHAKQYETTLTLQSHQMQGRFILGSGGGKSKGEAEFELAKLVSRSINSINSGSRPGALETIMKNDDLRSFARFLLGHEFATVPASPKGIARWHRVGLLGSRLLSESRLDAFAGWATTVQSLFRTDGADFPDTGRVLQFYRGLRVDTARAEFQRLQQIALDEIGDLLDNLDPTVGHSDVRQSRAFSQLLALSKVTRLLSRSEQRTTLADAFDDLLLLRRGRLPEVKLCGHFPALSILEREGVYSSFLTEAVALLARAGKDSDEEIHLAVEYKPSVPILDLTFDCSSIPTPEEVQNHIKTSLLWRFLAHEIPIVSATVTANQLRIRCAVRSDLPTASFLAQAHKAYNDNHGYLQSETQTMSRFLHDLKNQLIAYQVAVDASGTDRTSRLKSQYEASAHLDAALSLYRSLKAIGQALEIPSVAFVQPEAKLLKMANS